MKRLAILSAASLLLSGCGTVGAIIPDAAPEPVGRVATPPPPSTPSSMRGPGLEGVIDATAPELVRKFGQPRIDLEEGDARKLQFAGRACILDIYLYTLQRAQAQRASWIDARRSDGQNVDIAACIDALER